MRHEQLGNIFLIQTKKGHNMKVDEVLDTKDSQWRFEARKLMEAEKLFVVVNWSEHFDGPEIKGLTQEFDYNYGFWAGPNQVHFHPRKHVIPAHKK